MAKSSIDIVISTILKKTGIDAGVIVSSSSGEMPLTAAAVRSLR